MSQPSRPTASLRLIAVSPKSSLYRPSFRTYGAHQTPDDLIPRTRVWQLLFADLDDAMIVTFVVRGGSRDEENMESEIYSGWDCKQDDWQAYLDMSSIPSTSSASILGR
jgi:hypothetical protein